MIVSQMVVIGLLDGASNVTTAGGISGFHPLGGWAMLTGAGDGGATVTTAARGSMLAAQHVRRSIKRGRSRRYG